jgi:ABC-2 type transport system permease protein
MKMPDSFRLTIRNFKVNSDPGTIMFMLGLPTLYLLVLGFMYQSLIPSVVFNNVSVSYTDFLMPGIMGMEVMTAGTVGGSMLWSDRRFFMFEQLMVGPFNRLSYLFGLILVSLIFSIIGNAIMLAIFYLFVGKLVFSTIGLLISIFTLFIGTIIFTSIYMIISIKTKKMQTYNTITIVLFFVVDFTSSAFYPITSQTPYSLRVMSYLNPLTYITDITRSTLVFSSLNNVSNELLILTIATVIVFGIALKLYNGVKPGM